MDGFADKSLNDIDTSEAQEDCSNQLFRTIVCTEVEASHEGCDFATDFGIVCLLCIEPGGGARRRRICGKSMSLASKPGWRDRCA
jgi:hypothetical protein